MKKEIDLEEFKEYLITLFMKKESYTKEEIYDKINEVFDMVYDGSYILPEIKKY